MTERGAPGHSYQQAGVDIVSGARAKERIGSMIRDTYTDGVIGDFGHFGGMFRAPSGGSKVLVSSADSVGTKVLLAVHAGRHSGIGIDLVNHSVNDILCCGARPLFFLDYFATSRLDESLLEEIVQGLTEACREAGCALVGGETAQLPGIYQESTYDLAGFIVGEVDEHQIIDGSRIEPGHLIVGFPSNGLHTNGYSLARAVLGLAGSDVAEIKMRLDQHLPELGETLGEALLRPHRSYLHEVSKYLEADQLPTGLAHITGGGIAGNLERIIPRGCVARIDSDTWETPAIFSLIESAGNVAESEMYQVFNMGIGFIAVASQKVADDMASEIDGARIIGEIRHAENESARVDLVGVTTS